MNIPCVCIPFLLLLLSASAAQTEQTADTLSLTLREAVTVPSLQRHLQRFQEIADANGGNRAAGSAGYDASMDYVRAQLGAAGYAVTTQPFEIEAFEVLAPARLEQTSGEPRTWDEAVVTMNLSVSGEVTAPVQAVDVQLPPDPTNRATSGCEVSDFADFTPGSVALLQRGTCTFQTKVERATEAGASAAIIFNEGQAGRTEVFTGSLNTVSDIPVLSASYALGQALAEKEPEVRLVTETLAETRTTYNLIAETRGGDPGRVVMLGAHLDSVADGPGIHDNGSGSAATLEIALQLAEQGVNEGGSPLGTKLRFAWWGREELGLLGSNYYVNNLSGEELDRLQAYLNLDMIGSPNFVRFVYDGDESERETDLPLPEGTAAIEEVFLDYFGDRNIATAPLAVFSRSDHAPFARAGVAVGGLFTGAEGVKDEQEAERFGGQAGAAYDTCYHRACDTLENVNLGVLEQMADAAAHALVTLALPVPVTVKR